MHLDSEYFYNADHLNEKGASIVTGEMNRRIQALDPNLYPRLAGSPKILW
jgi:hypothetical protein